MWKKFNFKQSNLTIPNLLINKSEKNLKQNLNPKISNIEIQGSKL